MHEICQDFSFTKVFILTITYNKLSYEKYSELNVNLKKCGFVSSINVQSLFFCTKYWLMCPVIEIFLEWVNHRNISALMSTAACNIAHVIYDWVMVVRLQLNWFIG